MNKLYGMDKNPYGLVHGLSSSGHHVSEHIYRMVVVINHMVDQDIVGHTREHVVLGWSQSGLSSCWGSNLRWWWCHTTVSNSRGPCFIPKCDAEGPLNQDGYALSSGDPSPKSIHCLRERLGWRSDRSSGCTT